jgi:hypothetical protein
MKLAQDFASLALPLLLSLALACGGPVVDDRAPQNPPSGHGNLNPQPGPEPDPEPGPGPVPNPPIPDPKPQPPRLSPNLVDTIPIPGKIYPAGTTIGGKLFGAQYSVPAKWKGGLRKGTALTIFASDSEPGIIIGNIGFGYTAQDILANKQIQTGFAFSLEGTGSIHFYPSQPATLSGDRISVDYTAFDGFYQYLMVLRAVVHPDGGYVAFLGVTTTDQQAAMHRNVEAFINTIKITRRNTNKPFMAALFGKSFQWVKDDGSWFSDVSGLYSDSASFSGYTQSSASFCGNGAFWLNVSKESLYQATVDGEVMQLFDSTGSTEYGQLTVITEQGIDIGLLVTSKGYLVAPVQLTGNTLRIGNKQLAFSEHVTCG